MTGKAKWPLIPESAMERQAFREYRTTGSVHGLYLLADACEAGEEGVGKVRMHFAKLLREVADAKNPAVHWFIVNGTGRTNRDFEFETGEQTCLRGAACNAWYEARWVEKVNAGGWRFRWEIDGYDDEDGKEVNTWACVLEELVNAGWSHGRTSAWQTLPSWRSLTVEHAIYLGVMGAPPAAYTGRVIGDVDMPSPQSRIVTARMAERHMQMVAADDMSAPRPPNWMSIEIPRRKVIGVFRRAEDTNQESQIKWHPIQAGKVVVIFPCEPAEACFSHNVPLGMCEAYFVHERKLTETFHDHKEFMYRSFRVNPVLEADQIHTLKLLLAEKGIDVEQREFAPRGYYDKWKERFKQMQDDRIPF